VSAKNKVLVLNQFLPFRLLNASEHMSLQFAQRYRRKYELTRPEWRTFAILGEHGQITATDVGKLSHMHKTKVSRAIASLANRGWLVRERDQGDRRIEQLSLSARGRTNYAKLVDEAKAFNQEIEQLLGAKATATIWEAIEHLDRVKNTLYTASVERPN